MTDTTGAASLLEGVQRYLDLMYDFDPARFDRVFRPTAQLHGFHEGQLTMWSAAKFKDVLASRPSAKSLGAPREEEILLFDMASPTQAMVKLRVRINRIVFIDYLVFHRSEGEWQITAKAYHVERTIAA